ncbi:hypothetical protein ACFXJ8_07390 [Nonomuraea sp. NPDC059194]|uniref:hypothetical protein n=1 Tax=Nonomuraea sp. NPDC059194 TaxID=3346764 RepID=UPI00368F5DC6
MLETKASCCPSGDQTGSPAWKSPSVILRHSPRVDVHDDQVGAQVAQQAWAVRLVLQSVGHDGRVRVRLAVRGGEGQVKAVRRPHGVPAPSVTTMRGSPPSIGSRRRCGLPSTGRRKASVRPSGDQRDARSAGPPVRRRGSRPGSASHSSQRFSSASLSAVVTV